MGYDKMINYNGLSCNACNHSLKKYYGPIVDLVIRQIRECKNHAKIIIIIALL